MKQEKKTRAESLKASLRAVIWEKGLRRMLFTSESLLRPVWKMVLSVAAYYAAFYGILYGLAAIFGALFDAWGLTNSNLTAAPLWAQGIVYTHTNFCYAAAYLLSAGLAIFLSRKNARKVRCARKAIFTAIGIGLLMSSGLTLLAFALDSVRLEYPLSEPQFGIRTFTALLLILLGRFSHEVLCRRLIYAQCKVRKGWAILISGLIGTVLTGEWSVFGVFSGFLLGMAACALYDCGGLIATTAMQTIWTVWCTLLFGFPGMNANATPVFSLYHVSDAWLTGGNESILNGAWCAGILLVINIVLYRAEIRKCIDGFKSFRIRIKKKKG